MKLEWYEKLIAAVLLFLINSLLVMVLWNEFVAPELEMPDLSYLGAMAAVMIFRFLAPPTWESSK